MGKGWHFSRKKWGIRVPCASTEPRHLPGLHLQGGDALGHRPRPEPVERLEIEIEGLESGSATRVEARFETGSLRVVCAMKDGVEQPGTLSEGDRKKIEQTIREDVLTTKRSTEARFRSTRIEGDRIEGMLALNGIERPLAAQARREAGRATVEVELDHADFGIKPYKRLFLTHKQLEYHLFLQ